LVNREWGRSAISQVSNELIRIFFTDYLENNYDWSLNAEENSIFANPQSNLGDVGSKTT